MFIDYNLFGMNFINVDAVKFRRPLPHDTAANISITADVTGRFTLLHFNCNCWDFVVRWSLENYFHLPRSRTYGL